VASDTDPDMTERPTTSIRRRVLLAGAATLATSRIATARDFPSRPLRIVVPFPAGGPVGIMARIAAEALSARFG